MAASCFSPLVLADSDCSRPADSAKTKAANSPTAVHLTEYHELMARNSAVPPESFEEILAWLDPDREVAATMYVQLRHDLANIFNWRGCSDPEGLTDEVFDRVAKKVHEVRPTYVGDPRLYFRAVANNVFKEDLKKVKTHVCLDDDEVPELMASESQGDGTLDMEECLQSCLPKLS